jgi:hypothetical protein
MIMPIAASSELDQRLFWRLIEISTALSGERNTSRLFERILDAAQDITHADGGTLYLIKEREEGKPVLEFEIMRNNSLQLRLGGTSGNPIQFARYRCIGMMVRPTITILPPIRR